MLHKGIEMTEVYRVRYDPSEVCCVIIFIMQLYNITCMWLRGDCMQHPAPVTCDIIILYIYIFYIYILFIYFFFIQILCMIVTPKRL